MSSSASTPCQSLPPTLPTLLSLPTELLLTLISHLPTWPTLLSLRLTHQTFTTLLPPSTLKSYHTHFSTLLYTQELALHRRLEEEHWDIAQQVSQGILPSCYLTSSASTGDPDLDALSKRQSCASEVLPCYRCLRWLSTTSMTLSSSSASTSASLWIQLRLPSDTDSTPTSTFNKSQRTLSYDLAGLSSRQRFCLPCGIRINAYPVGTIVNNRVRCLSCGQFGEFLGKWEGEARARAGAGSWFRGSREAYAEYERWWCVWFCRGCFEGSRDEEEEGKDNGGRGDGRWYWDAEEWVDRTGEQFEHERRWRRYERGMRKGKEYRVEKGKRLREGRGILWGEMDDGGGDREQGDKIGDGRGLNAGLGGYCPIMRETRFCSCGKKKN